VAGRISGKAIAFDRRANVGLHHLALAVADQIGLDMLYKRVSVGRALPSSSGRNPRVPAPRSIHRAEPSGVRIEFAFDPRLEDARKAL